MSNFFKLLWEAEVKTKLASLEKTLIKEIIEHSFKQTLFAVIIFVLNIIFIVLRFDDFKENFAVIFVLFAFQVFLLANLLRALKFRHSLLNSLKPKIE